MTPLDRDAVLRQADSLARQGQLDLAIAEYVRLVDERPRDWSAVNALGDLYVRAGRVDEAIEAFLRVAHGVAGEGFSSRAIAFYRKILKLAPNHERAQQRMTELQGQKDRGEASGVPLKPAAGTAKTEAVEPVKKPAPQRVQRTPVSGSTIDEVFAQLREEAQQEPEFRDAESRIDEMIKRG